MEEYLRCNCAIAFFIWALVFEKVHLRVELIMIRYVLVEPMLRFS